MNKLGIPQHVFDAAVKRTEQDIVKQFTDKLPPGEFRDRLIAETQAVAKEFTDKLRLPPPQGFGKQAEK